MRKLLVAAFAVIGFLSVIDSASAAQRCISYIAYPHPHCNGYMNVPSVAPGHPINGPHSVMPYAIRRPPGIIQPRVAYHPMVPRYGHAGYAMQTRMPVQTGARVQAYSYERFSSHTVHSHGHHSPYHIDGMHDEVISVPD